jgi:hypothetical protein
VARRKRNTRLPEADPREAIIDRIAKNDESAVPEFQDLLRELPSLVEAGGNLAEIAGRKLVEAITGANLLFRETLQAKLDAMRKDLAGTQLSPIERLLAERAIACWLQLYHADAIVAQTENCSLERGDYQQRRQDRAHRRFLSAIKTLATVRRLASPIRVDVKVAGTMATKESAPMLVPERWRMPITANN